MTCTDRTPAGSKRGRKTVTTAPHEAGRRKAAEKFRAIARASPTRGNNRHENVVQRPRLRNSSSKLKWNATTQRQTCRQAAPPSVGLYDRTLPHVAQRSPEPQLRQAPQPTGTIGSSQRRQLLTRAGFTANDPGPGIVPFCCKDRCPKQLTQRMDVAAMATEESHWNAFVQYPAWPQKYYTKFPDSLGSTIDTRICRQSVDSIRRLSKQLGYDVSSVCCLHSLYTSARTVRDLEGN